MALFNAKESLISGKIRGHSTVSRFDINILDSHQAVRKGPISADHSHFVSLATCYMGKEAQVCFLHIKDLTSWKWGARTIDRN